MMESPDVSSPKGGRQCGGAATETSGSRLRWPTLHRFGTASINITASCQRYKGPLRGGDEADLLGDLVALIGGGGPGRRAPFPHSVVFVISKVRVEGDEEAGTGRWNRCRGPAFLSVITKKGRGRNRCKKRERDPPSCLLRCRHRGGDVNTGLLENEHHPDREDASVRPSQTSPNWVWRPANAATPDSESPWHP